MEQRKLKVFKTTSWGKKWRGEWGV